MKRKLIVILATFLPLSLLIATLTKPIPKPMEFSTEQWTQANDRNQFEPRLAMVESLLEQNVLEGMSSEEIQTVLGPPAANNYFKNSDMMYRLGGKGRILKSPFYLAITLKDNEFQSAQILQD